jgi:integrase
MEEIKNPIIKNNVLILRPYEYKKIRNSVKRDRQILLDTLLLTGMRYIELERLYANPSWFDGSFIHLPEFAQGKVKRKQKERWIRLSIMGKTMLPQFFELNFIPDRIAFDKWLSYNFKEYPMICAKTFRKTWESWLLITYPHRSLEIALSQGHTQLTQLNYYANLPFTDQDKEDMKEFVMGW